ncbi:MAG: ABC transporter permease [Lentisphaeria bacterium]|nr:ABC transporter permease [Lentisphaeria bacterium]
MKAAAEESVTIGELSQWQLVRMRFRRHKLAVVALYALGAMYLIAVFAGVVAPYPRDLKNLDRMHCPPQIPRLSLKHGLHTFNVRQHSDPVSLLKIYRQDRADIVPLGFFVKGYPYRLWGMFPARRHLFGVNVDRYARRVDMTVEEARETATFHLMGCDRYGRDLFSRIVYGARVSLSIGLLAIVSTFILGLVIGGISGYAGGKTDLVIQRLIEIINAIPRLPMWLALGAAVPATWSGLTTYFCITLLLSLLGWTGLARVVRGKILSLREEDYAVAARLLGASDGRILFRHLLPGFTSHILVSLTLRVPVMILGETSLSFLGLGLRPPVVSWGVLLQDCMSMRAVAQTPWLLLPVVFIIVTVLSFNFLGDGLRDAADPYH